MVVKRQVLVDLLISAATVGDIDRVVGYDLHNTQLRDGKRIALTEDGGCSKTSTT